MTSIGSVDQFAPDSIHKVSISGKELLIIRSGDEWFAIENRCSHDGNQLEDGDLIDGQIECPRHGARFDLRSGTPTMLPAVVPIKTYKLDVSGSDVYLKES